jgi:type IV pilus assembly protein PilE
MLSGHLTRSAPGARTSRDRLGGLTLIEVLVVISILSLLVAIALPSYTEHVARAKRADARTQLLQAAQFMQRFYAANDDYQADRAGNAIRTQIPANLLKSPADSEAVYTLEIPVATLTRATFEIQMVPVPGGPMAADKCGTFALSSLGVRSVIVGAVQSTSALRDSCWK